MNCLSGSGEFQEVEWNYNETFSHVPSQPAGVLSPRSVLSCDKRLPLDTWNLSGSRENVFGNPHSMFGSSRTPLSRNSSLYDTKCCMCGSNACLCRDTCCKRTYAGRPSTMNSFLPVEISQKFVAGQQRQEISELQFDTFPTPSTFFCWKIRFNNQVTNYLFRISLGCHVMDHRSGDGQ